MLMSSDLDRLNSVQRQHSIDNLATVFDWDETWQSNYWYATKLRDTLESSNSAGLKADRGTHSDRCARRYIVLRLIGSA